ncbi:MAG TPA: cytochrome c [Mucilaginibacter sp.]|nr:cytochrome c [Mucilaginibacter sp.]
MKTLRINNGLFIKRAFYVAVIALATSLIASRSLAQQHTPWVAPKPAQDVKNPIAVDKTILAEGKALYAANCAPCHGDKGRGDGVAAAALNPKPADHTSATVQAETDGSLFWKLTQGRNPMPSYQKILNDKQRWELVCYIRTLSKDGNKRIVTK